VKGPSLAASAITMPWSRPVMTATWSTATAAARPASSRSPPTSAPAWTRAWRAASACRPTAPSPWTSPAARLSRARATPIRAAAVRAVARARSAARSSRRCSSSGSSSSVAAAWPGRAVAGPPRGQGPQRDQGSS
jgi:hypothetical protein